MSYYEYRTFELDLGHCEICANQECRRGCAVIDGLNQLAKVGWRVVKLQERDADGFAVALLEREVR